METTAFADAMKTYYLDPLNDQVYRSHVLLDRIEKNSEDVAGNFAYVALISTRNPGVGSRKDKANSGPVLPLPGRQGYDAATYKMALHYLRGSVSGPVMRASSKGKQAAFASAMDTEMKGLMKRGPEDLNRQLWSYGHGRAASFVGTQATSTKIEVNSHAIFKARVGDRVHVADIAGATTANLTPSTGAVITNIEFDKDAAGAASTIKHTVTLDVASGAITVGEDALYYGTALSGSIAADDSSRQTEMFGIPALVDDGNLGADEGLGSGDVEAADANEFIAGSLNFGDISRTSNAFWRAQVMQNPDGAGTNRPLTVALMEEGFLRYTTVGGGNESTLEIYTNPELWATFGLLHIGDRRFNDYKKTLEGGWIAIEFNGRPIFKDRDAQRDIFWFLDMEDIMFLTQSGYEFMDDDGAILHRVSDRDAYEFTMYRDCQLGARRSASHVKLDDCASVMRIDAAI